MAKEKVTETSIRELCNRVASDPGHLLANDTDAITVYQDLIGHATEEENTELCNDPALNETWYRIYGVAYGTTAAIKWYLNHSNQIAEMKCDLEEYMEQLDNSRTMHKNSEERAKFWEDKSEEYKGQLEEAKRDMEGTVKELERRDKEIMELKAKLYDLMQKGE